MSYNIEEHEAYLKNNSPYDDDDAQWNAMQQRIKAAVLTTTHKKTPVQATRLTFWKLTTAAAILCAVLSVGFVLLSRQHGVVPPGSLTVVKAGESKPAAEQLLDSTIATLNEAELNWLHRLNENDITEQNEYSEN